MGGTDEQFERAITVPAKRNAVSKAAPLPAAALDDAALADGASRTPSTDDVRNQLHTPAWERLRHVAELTRGGMAKLDVVVDEVLQRRLARKTILPQLENRDTTWRMFVREAQITSRLSHPNIVPVHDIAYDEEGHLSFTMKLLHGETLTELIESFPSGPLSRDELFTVIDVVIKVCDALAYAHSRGVLHCDVKPCNVMVGDFGQVYLMDWGVAQVMDRPARAPSSGPGANLTVEEAITDPLELDEEKVDSLVLGTPNYMSPEQASGPRALLDGRADVFSVGAMLFEAFTRRPPYLGKDTQVALAHAHLGRIPAVSTVVGPAAIPPALERIIMKALAYDREQRYANVAALRADLVSFARGDGEFPRMTVSAGHTIIAEDDAPDAAYIIVRGSCEVSQSDDGQRRVVRVMEAGEVFGEAAILSDSRRTATVVALQETELIVISRSVLNEEVGVLKPWLRSLLQSLAQRFGSVDQERRRAVRSADKAD